MNYATSVRDQLREETHCPVCDSTSVRVFLKILDVPVHCNLLYPTEESAIRVQRGDIVLTFCKVCQHIFNSHFDPDRMEYTGAYENSLDFSRHFQEYVSSLASGLIDRYNLRQKQVVEIGCGEGDFLRLLCKGGGNRGVGFDPSYKGPDNGSLKDENIRIIADFYSDRYAHYKADLICCRHMLEHIERPRDFLLQVRRAIGQREETVVFFEVPNALYTIRDLGIWDIIYEHCSYFSAQSLIRTFQDAGFTVLNVYAVFGDQFLCLEASPSVGVPSDEVRGARDMEELSILVSTFGESFRNKIKTWNEKLSQLFEGGSRLAMWGAGSKGVTFLNTVNGADQIGYAVDINLRKQGMYVAGTGQRIVSPEFLREYRPDTILVMNPNYLVEIQRNITQLGLKAEILPV